MAAAVGGKASRERGRVAAHQRRAVWTKRQLALMAERRELVAFLLRQAATIYDSLTIPPLEGGWLFRELATYTGMSEGQIAVIATEIGLWPWKPWDLAAAVKAVRGE